MKNNSNRDEIYEKNSRIHWDRLQNKKGDFKGAKYNPSFGQDAGIQKTLVETYKDNTKKSTEQKAEEEGETINL